MKLGTLVALVVFAFLPGCKMGEEKSKTADSKKNVVEKELVRTIFADRGKLAARLQITARVEALEFTDIIPRAEGTVVKVEVVEGQNVEKGELLALIENDEETIRVAAQELACEQASIAVSMAKLSKDESDSMLAAFETTLRREENECKRCKAQHERGAISDKDLEAAQYVYTKALADREQANLKAKRAAEEVLKARIDARTAQNTLESEKLKLSFTELRATIKGRVTKRAIRVGQKAVMGQAAFTIADFDTLVVRARIPETDLRVLKAGLNVNLAATAYPGVNYQGIVDLVASEVDKDGGQIPVRIKLDQGEPPLRPGMFVSGHIVTEERDGSLLVPRKALLFDRDRPYVYIVERVDGQKSVKKIYMKRGLQNATSVEYLPLDGEEARISDETEIVVVGLDRLVDGAQVVIEGEEQSDESVESPIKQDKTTE